MVFQIPFCKESRRMAGEGEKTGVAAQAAMDVLRVFVPAAVPRRIAGDGLDKAVEQQARVRSSLGRSRDRGGALDGVGVADRPLIGLLRPHRDSKDKRQLLDAKFLGEQPALRADIVADTNIWKPGRVERWFGTVRRAGKPVADLIDEDDEIFFGIERSARPKIGEFQNFAAARIPSRKKDRIVLLSPKACRRWHRRAEGF